MLCNSSSNWIAQTQTHAGWSTGFNSSPSVVSESPQHVFKDILDRLPESVCDEVEKAEKSALEKRDALKAASLT
eukprot:5637126-Amphidinium_carterae.1